MPTIAVIIPVFKHSVYAVEAINSSIGQSFGQEIFTIIVDDGCPFQETRMICRSYATTIPGVVYLRQNNKGLSAARNRGVRFVLDYLPEVQAVYFLDADNRLTNSALAQAWAFLKALPDVDWIYPSVDKFAVEWHGNYGGEHQPLLHLLWDNICEAGSLVRRRVFESGIRFDEGMRSGYEDWDFWLTCLKNGYRCKHYEYFGLLYRQRFSSMIYDAKKGRDAIRGHIRRKHAHLFRASLLLRLEHDSSPRFAAIDPMDMKVRRFTDPRFASTSSDLLEYADDYWASKAEPDSFAVSPFLAWITSRDLDVLVKARVINAIFLEVERLCETYLYVRLVIISTVDDSVLITSEDAYGLSKQNFGVRGWFCSRKTLDIKCQSPESHHIGADEYGAAGGKVATLLLGLPARFTSSLVSERSPMAAMIETFEEIASVGQDMDLHRWNWRAHVMPDRSNIYRLFREELNCNPVGNFLKVEKIKNIGFVISEKSSAFEIKFLLGLAEAARNMGFEVHALFGIVLSPAISEQALSLFHTLRSLGDRKQEVAPTCNSGVSKDWREKLSNVELCPDMANLLDLDVIVHARSEFIYNACDILRSFGVKLIDYISETDNPWNVGLFEHAHETIVTTSESIKDALHAFGVPLEKIEVLPLIIFDCHFSKPSEDFVRRKMIRVRAEPLLFVALVDACDNFGLSTLCDIIGGCNNIGLEIKWRIVVLGLDGLISFSWADVFARLGCLSVVDFSEMPSDGTYLLESECVILTKFSECFGFNVVQAQRLGCIPIVFSADPCQEYVRDQINGLLVRSEGPDIAVPFVRLIRILLEDANARFELSSSCMFNPYSPNLRNVDRFLYGLSLLCE